MSVTDGEPVFRMWGWEERSQSGRNVYVYHMALEYLLARNIPIPVRLATTLSKSLVAWEEDLKAMNPAIVAAHEVTESDLPEITNEAHGRFVRDAHLPVEVGFDADDRAVLAALPISSQAWDKLSPQREAVLSLRLAIDFVRHANGVVPEGVIRELRRAVERGRTRGV